MITGVHHTGVIVSSIEKVLPFYRDTLGMKVTAKLGVQDGPEVPIIMGIPNAKVDIVMLQIGGQTFELIQLVNPVGKAIPSETPFGQVGHGHIAYQVDNIRDAYRTLKQKGVKVVLPPQEIPGVMEFFYVRDPDGLWVELVHPLE